MTFFGILVESKPVHCKFRLYQHPVCVKVCYPWNTYNSYLFRFLNLTLHLNRPTPSDPIQNYSSKSNINNPFAATPELHNDPRNVNAEGLTIPRILRDTLILHFDEWGRLRVIKKPQWCVLRSASVIWRERLIIFVLVKYSRILIWSTYCLIFECSILKHYLDNILRYYSRILK